jgi:hypothetical protein
MAFAASAVTSDPRSFSIGPLKMEIQSFTMLSGDTSGTVTSGRMATVKECFIIGGVAQSAAPSINGNVVTLAFADTATGTTGYNAARALAGSVILLGV